MGQSFPTLVRTNWEAGPPMGVACPESTRRRCSCRRPAAARRAGRGRDWRRRPSGAARRIGLRRHHVCGDLGRPRAGSAARGRPFRAFPDELNDRYAEVAPGPNRGALRAPTDGRYARRGGRARSALAVPLSARCRSSGRDQHSDRSSGACSSQGLEIRQQRVTSLSRRVQGAERATVKQGSCTSKSAATRRQLSHALGRLLGHADPMGNDRRRAISPTCRSGGSLPSPAAPSTSTTAPEPERTCVDRADPSPASSRSRPRDRRTEW